MKSQINPALLTNDAVEFFYDGSEYYATSNGSTTKVSPGTQVYQILLDAIKALPDYKEICGEYPQEVDLVFGVIRDRLSGFNSKPDMIAGCLTDYDGYKVIMVNNQVVKGKTLEIMKAIAEGIPAKQIEGVTSTVLTQIKNLKTKYNLLNAAHTAAAYITATR